MYNVVTALLIPQEKELVHCHHHQHQYQQHQDYIEVVFVIPFRERNDNNEDNQIIYALETVQIFLFNLP